MNIPPELKLAIKEKKVIPFIGAGVSLSVNGKDGNNLFPSWHGLLSSAIEIIDAEGLDSSIAKKHLIENEYILAASVVKKEMGGQWHEFLRYHFDPSFDNVDKKTFIIPNLVWHLGSNLIITTNYDRVLYWSCPYNNISQLTYRSTELLHFLSSNKPCIWYIHGNLDDIENIVLDQNSYNNNYLITNGCTSAFIQTFRSMIIQKNILFIGFSLADVYVRNQFFSIQNAFSGTAGPHYILMKRSEKKIIDNLRQNLDFDIRPVYFENFGSPMVKLISELSKGGNHEEPTSQFFEDISSKESISNILLNQSIGLDHSSRSFLLSGIPEAIISSLPTVSSSPYEQCLSDFKTLDHISKSSNNNSYLEIWTSNFFKICH